MTWRINRCSHCGCDEPILGIDGKLYCDNCGMSLEKLKGVPTMAENKMAQIAALFGKKLDEPFEVGICGEMKSKRHKCKLTEGGLYEWYEDWQKWVFDPDDILHDLLTGNAKIVED